MTAARIISMLFSSKSRMHLSDEEAESRVDYISDYLGIPKGIVIRIVNLLREESILADTKDMTAFIKKAEYELFIKDTQIILSNRKVFAYGSGQPGNGIQC